MNSSCIKTIPSSEGDRETTRYRDLFSEVESEITLLKRKYEQLTKRVEDYESSQATKCCTCVSLQPELTTHCEHIRRLEDNVLLLNNFIRNHSHTGTSTISDSKSCAPITHSHKPAPVQSHAGSTTSGHNGTPIPNHRAAHIPAANLSLTIKPNPNHSPTRRPPTHKHAQHYNHAPNSALEHCPTHRHIPDRSCLPPPAAECNHRPVLDRTPARSSALDYSLSRKPALSHYTTRDSVLDLNLALNPSSKIPYKYSKPHNPLLNPSHFPPSNLSLHSPHNPASNQGTGNDYKSDKSPPNPINATLSAKHPSKNITLILGDSNTKYTFIPNSFRIATYVIEDIDPEMCREYKSVWIQCGVNNLKPTTCHSIKDVRDIFNLFIEKLCPFTKVIVSPILPTGLCALNNRIGYFNRLLFKLPNWWV